jgi:signal recognition particle subunit SRP54
MKQVGSAPGLLARLPGVKQLMQLRKLQGKGMEDVLGEDAAAVEKAMAGGLVPPDAARAMGLPKGYTPPMASGAMARARLMGYAPEPITVESAKERDARKKKRKQERQARKKNRKRNRK